MNRLRPSRASHVLLPAALCALAIPAAAQPGLRPGQPVSGTLAVSDLRLNDGSYADHFTYRGRRGERLVVVMRSGDFDTYLALGRGGGADFAQLSAADDGAGGTDSRLEFTLPDDGEYTVRANSLRKGQTGAYTLEVQGAGADPGPPPVEPGAAERVERGTLGPGDGTLRTGEYRDSYTLQGRRGERLVLDLRSRDLDPYLILVKPDGEQEENDDYEGDARRSLLSVELPADGEYRVLATTYAPRTTGSYELRISRGGAGSAGGGTRREQGRLESGDGTLRTGEYRDSYEVQAVPGQRLRVDASSSDFDTYLIVVDPRGQQRENDDAEGQPGHSVVEMEATESGAHRVVVTSYRRGETGAYTLSIDQGSAAGTAPAGRDVSALSLGGAPLSGRLAAGDRRLRNGEFSDGYVIDGREGQVLVVEMASRDFDTYLVVTTPDGQQVDNDDHEGSNRRSRVELPMRQSGRYRVIATSYRKGEVGAYTLTARAGGQEAPRVVQAARPGPTRVGGRTSSGLPPGTGNGGRVYGVFVGVSDYGGRAGNLPFTARDARTMRDAMVRGVGMQAGDAVVLTDRQATTAAVRQAVRSLAGRMGPDDILVFFHSGHGSRVPTRGTDDDDPDGMDETIEMYDAGIRDDELGEMLEEVRSGLVLVVIDACFSGGFSKDVINRPGRIGFFSSEEDVVSSVAAKFQAGGYLPVFVAEAVGDGRGDTEDEALSPRGDGRLSLLELSEYLRERYGTELRSDGSSGRASSRDEVVRRDISYQHLVVDRGGVDPYTVLFRW